MAERWFVRPKERPDKMVCPIYGDASQMFSLFWNYTSDPAMAVVSCNRGGVISSSPFNREAYSLSHLAGLGCGNPDCVLRMMKPMLETGTIVEVSEQEAKQINSKTYRDAAERITRALAIVGDVFAKDTTTNA